MKTYTVVAAFVVMVFCAYGQIATITSLVGTVTDSSGKAIAGAKITAVDSATLDQYNVVTNQDGNYRIEFVRVGTYDLTAEYPGFSRVKVAGSIVTTNQIVRNNFTMSPGSVQESVTVEAAAPVIKTDDATISATISSKQITELPMNGRNVLMLAATTPGVLPGTKGTQGVPPGQAFVGAGTREIQNSMSLDGISIMNNLITTSPTQPMVETVQEVEVQTGTYSAQYGAYLGVHLNMVTKGGTNAIHGNLVEFIRNDAFDARGYFLPATSNKTALRQNQYGFEVGRPRVYSQVVQWTATRRSSWGPGERLLEQTAEPFGQQHGDDAADVCGGFFADDDGGEGPFEQPRAVRGQYRAYQPAFADGPGIAAILCKTQQPECDHAKLHNHIPGQEY